MSVFDRIVGPTWGHGDPLAANNIALLAASNNITDDEDETSVSMYIMAIAIAVISNISTSAGFLLWKSSSTTEKDVPVCQRWRWWLGLFFLGPLLVVFNLLAYSLLEQSTIACFAGLSIVFSALITHFASSERKCLAWCTVREQLELTDWGLIACIFIGVSLITTYQGVTAGDDGSEALTLTQASIAIRNTSTVAYVVMAWTLGTVCSTFLVCKGFDRCVTAEGVPYIAVLMAFTGATCASVSVACMRVISAAAYAVASSGLQVLTTFPGSDFWYALVTLLIDVPFQFVLLQATLTHAPVALGVPAYQSFVVLMGLFASYVIWQPAKVASDRVLEHLSSLATNDQTMDVIISVASVALVIAGLAMLCYRQQVRQRRDTDVSNSPPLSTEFVAGHVSRGPLSEGTPLVDKVLAPKP